VLIGKIDRIYENNTTFLLDRRLVFDSLLTELKPVQSAVTPADGEDACVFGIGLMLVTFTFLNIIVMPAPYGKYGSPSKFDELE
jgi:hypothetical protein